MQRNFAKSLSLVLKSEGGYSNHPDDPGGPTNKGITLATMRRYVDRNATVDDLKHITEAQVATVYRKQYWDKVCGNDLPGGIDFATFDFAVNSGPARAAKYLQAALGIARDGVIGPATIAAARSADARKIIDRLCADRLAFLKRLRTWPTFGRGWTARVSSVETEALGMVQAKPASAPRPVPAPEQPAKPKPAPAPAPAARPGLLAPILAALATALALAWGWVADLPCSLLNLFCGG